MQFTYCKYTEVRARFWFFIVKRMHVTVIPFSYLLT